MRESEPLDLETILEKVVSILVSTFDFPEEEARHRVTLWKSQQHDLEGQALAGILPLLSPEQKAQELLRWALEGKELEQHLRHGAKELGLDLAE